MNQRNRRRLLFFLVAAIILLAAWLSLPVLLRGTLAGMLGEAGFVLEELDLRSTGLTETRIAHMRIRNEDNGLYEIEELVATYSPADLMAGSLDNVAIDRLMIAPSSRSQPLARLLQAVVALMEQDWRESVPVRNLRLETLLLNFPNGRQIEAELLLKKEQDSLSSVVHLHRPEKPVLRFLQGKDGNWSLEASNSEENAFATMTFERGRDYPLALEADTDLARLRQWSTLFGIPFPAHNAGATGFLHLKPDTDARQADFRLGGTASDMNEPELRIGRAETHIEGTLGWSDASSDITATLTGDLSMQDLQRDAMDAGQLDFRFSGDLSMTGEGLAGTLAPGLVIEAKTFSLEKLRTEDARLISGIPQPFSWEQRDGRWQFGPANYDLNVAAIHLGETTIRDNSYELAHDTWHYPFRDATGFRLNGSSTSIGADAFRLSGLELKNAGTISWPVDGKPPAIEFDLDINAEQIDTGALSAKDLAITGPLSLAPGETPGATLSEGFNVRLHDLKLGETGMTEAGIRLLTPLLLAMPSGDDRLPVQGAGRLSFDYGALSHQDYQLEPGSIDLTFEEADPVTGIISGKIDAGAPVFVSAGRQWSTSGVNGSFMLSADALKLDGSLVLDNTDSRISYEMVHELENSRGQFAFSTAAQPVQSLSEPLRTLGAPLPQALQLLSGTASLAGEVRWKHGLETITATLLLKNAGGQYGKAYFSGLESSFDLALHPALSGQSNRFSVAVIDLGVPITNLTSRISLEAEKGKKPVITLSRLKAGMLSGTVSGNPIRIDLNRNSNSFALSFTDISLAELVRMQQFEDIDAIGNLSGTLPITIGPAGLSITRGQASAKAPGGYIRYRPKDGGELFGSSSMESEMLLKALDDYQYEELDAAVAYKPDGQLSMQLQMKGRSPGLHATRPLHLNLNLDQNILSLIESLRAVDGLNEKIDRAVKQHFKARNR